MRERRRGGESDGKKGDGGMEVEDKIEHRRNAGEENGVREDYDAENFLA
jgi:hypothetical protein